MIALRIVHIGRRLHDMEQRIMSGSSSQMPTFAEKSEVVMYPHWSLLICCRWNASCGQGG
jgi:hypothetical protein